MHIEIEAKLKVDSLGKIEEKLTKVGAEFLSKQLHTDCYFDDAQGSLLKSDKCLRVRRMQIGQSEKVVLAFKGPREKDRFKKRPEIEINLENLDSAGELLLALGYEKSLVFQKKRKLWQLGDCEIALDQLPLLGGFVEIEGPNEGRITEVQAELELSGLVHIKQSYALLMKEKLCQLGAKQTEVLFNSN